MPGAAVRGRLRRSVVGAACLALLALLPAVSPAAAADTALDRYLAQLATLRVDFTQTLTDARGRRLESVTGSLAVQRPGRFRWEVRPQSSAAAKPGAPAAFSQLMVADGRNVWFFDRELEQVTVKPAAGALTATPALLLSGSVDVHQAFRIESQPRSAGLDWVRVTPKRSDAEFREARLGFAAGELRRMEIADRLGQKAVLSFGRNLRNAPIDPTLLIFIPPPGVDVIGRPAS